MPTEECVKGSPPGEQEPGPKSDCEKWIRQLLLNLLFFSLGIAALVRGPSLQDLKDLYHTDLPTISYTYLCGSLGGIIGSFLIGAALHKLPKFHYTIILFDFILMGIGNALLPHCQVIWLFLVASGLTGFSMGAGHTALNVLCLEVWQGRNAAPFMHSLHFFFSLGAFVSPLITKPFLSQELDVPAEILGNDTDHQANGSIVFDSENRTIYTTETAIGTLYPLCSIIIWSVCVGVMFFSAREIYLCSRNCGQTGTSEDAAKEKDSSKKKGGLFESDVAVVEKSILLTLMMLYFLLYICSEMAVASYLPTFAIECDLKLSRAEAADVLAVLFLPFCLSRIIGIFAALKMSPNQILTVNFSLGLIGNILLTSRGYYDIYFLCAGGAITGLGMGSIFANAIMWIEQYIPVKGPVASMIGSSAGVGVIFTPIIFGNTIESTPMILPYFQISITIAGILIFTFTGLFIGRRIRRKEKEAKKGEEHVQDDEELKALNSVNVDMAQATIVEADM